MTILDIPAPEGAVMPVAAKEFRPSVEPSQQRSSSPLDQDPLVGSDQASERAAGIGASERALRTAQGMMGRYVSTAGKGTASQLVAVVEGIRQARLEGAGLMVTGQGEGLNVGVVLLADPLVLLAVDGPLQALHWSLLPGGPSVTARADGLRLIRSLATGGSLTFQFGARVEMPPLDLDGGPWNDEDEWRLFEDLAVLEEWSGVSIPMPELVSAEDATMAAQAASWARTQRIDAQLTGVITLSADADPPLETANELRLHQDFGVDLLGARIPLGEGVATVRIPDIKRLADNDQTFRASPEQAHIWFSLAPPAGRRSPARRTQPERVAPPTRGTEGRIPTRLSVVRPARRHVSLVLAEHAPHRMPSSERLAGTGGLLDQIRGE